MKKNRPVFPYFFAVAAGTTLTDENNIVKDVVAEVSPHIPWQNLSTEFYEVIILLAVVTVIVVVLYITIHGKNKNSPST